MDWVGYLIDGSLAVLGAWGFIALRSRSASTEAKVVDVMERRTADEAKMIVLYEGANGKISDHIKSRMHK